MNDSARQIWRVTIRELSVRGGEPRPHDLYVVSPATSEKKLVQELRSSKFTPSWWDEHTVIDTKNLGEVWYEG